MKKKPREAQHKKARHCAICGKPLAESNPNKDRCFSHATPTRSTKEPCSNGKPKEKASGGKSSPAKIPPPSSPGPTWKTEAVRELKDESGSSSKVAICYQRFIERLDAPDMDAVVKKIGPKNLSLALLHCFCVSPEAEAEFELESPRRPDAHDLRAAARRAADLATFVAKHESHFRGRLIPPLRSGLEISNADFVDALKFFSLGMDEAAISLGHPNEWGEGYIYGGIILPRPQGKGKRIEPKVWDLAKTLELHFRENLKNHPHHGAIAILCSATFEKKFTEDNIKHILKRYKEKSARPFVSVLHKGT